MLSLKNLSCRRDSEQLFVDVNQLVYRSQKIGVTGANGTGKSSLFGLILGHLEPDDGEIEIQNGVLVAHVAQEMQPSRRSALDYVVDGDVRLRGIEHELEKTVDGDGDVHALLLADYDTCGGYTASSRAGALLHGLGFSGAQHQQPVDSFSGGWRMRLNLAQALMCPSDLLLLDEPTNHLDLDAVLWLEQWLQSYTGALLLISHDREFLDRTIGHILHIEQRGIRLYTGNYSAFELARAERLSGEQSAFERQQRKIQEIQGFVDRFRAKATKARQAQSRLKMLERMTRIAPAHIDSSFEFSFKVPRHLPNPLVSLDKVRAGYPDNVVFRDVRVSLQPGDRVGLLGLNGAGKSTLLKTMVGELAPLAGECSTSPNLAIGYFAQHQIDQLQFELSPLQHLLALDTAVTETNGRDFLGGFGFQGDQVFQTVGTLSGGEKARLALALIVHQRPNLLLLDEPTNHLDIDMRQALCEALQMFSGALVVISHDRFLLRSVADEFWLVDSGAVKPFDEDLDGYAKWLSTRRQRVSQSDSTDLSSPDMIVGQPRAVAPGEQNQRIISRKDKKREEAERRKKLQPLRNAASSLEKEADRLRNSLATVTGNLGDNQLYSSEHKTKLAELLQQQAMLKTQLSDTEENWLTALEVLERAEQDEGT